MHGTLHAHLEGVTYQKAAINDNTIFSMNIALEGHSLKTIKQFPILSSLPRAQERDLVL